jgi:BlaR1 peptidase M56/TonB-dependent Receptor Plug Domain
MIAALMLYSLAITTLFAIAAAAAEHLLRLARRPARVVWIVAMLTATGFSAVRFQSGLSKPTPLVETGPQRMTPPVVQPLAGELPRPPIQASAPASTALESSDVPTTFVRLNPAPIPIVSGSAVTRFDRPLVIGWFAITAIGLSIILLSAIRLSRPRPRWSTTTVDGVPVLVSHDLGPAVIGILRYRIVLPAWALELTPVERDLILAHEREHASAGDPSLLLLATVLLALTPWNAPLWWMVRRLRYAIELDCDARVLKGRPDLGTYGSLLLDVSERTMGGAMPIAALAESVSLIERRIAAMTSRLPRFAMMRGLAAGIIAAALVVVACSAPHPTSAPAPSAVAKPTVNVDSIRLLAARDSIAMLSRSLDSLRRATEVSPALYAQLDTALRSMHRDSSLRRLLQANGDTVGSAQLRFQVDSLRRLLESSNRNDRASSAVAGSVSGAAEPLFVVDGVVVSGGSWQRIAPSDIQSVEVIKGSASVAQYGASGEKGVISINTKRGGKAPAEVAAEFNRREANARAAALKAVPSAFEAHDGRAYLIVLVIDSTGSTVKAGMATRPALAVDERISDREVLKAVFPTLSITTFSGWGMSPETGANQSKGSGVFILYAFTGKAPW